jgi:hypothetical protein
MEVPAAGMGASGPNRPSAPSVTPPAHLPPAIDRNSGFSGDTVATLLRELSQADLTRLLEIVESPLLRTADAGRIDELLDLLRESVVSENTGRALDLLRQVVTLSPQRAETLSANPELAAIRPALEQLLSQVTAGSRLRAEGRLLEAAQKVELTRAGYSGEIKPEIFLSLAEKLIEAGGLPNYIRSEAVSVALLDPALWVPATVLQVAPDPPLLNTWRVTLRLLIALWISLGLAAIALCWWLRAEYLPTVALVWAAGGLVLLVVREWRSRPS